MRRFTKSALIGGCIGLIGLSAAYADTDTLEQVTVTAKRLEEEIPQELAKYGTRVDVITAAQIKNGGFTDVATALQTLAPGLFISPKNGPFDYVHASFQGSSTGDILWLVDGVRINNRLYNGTTPLDTLPASMVERIEIIEGGQALFYGTQAVAGAVNIVTKSFSDTPDGAIAVAADTINDRHFDGYARDTIGKGQFVVYGSADKSSGYQPFRDEDFQPSATDRSRDYEVLTLGVKYAYNFSDKIRLTLSEQHTDGRLDDLQPQLVNTAFNDRDEDLATAKLDIEASDVVQFFIKTYYHDWRSHYTEFDNTIPPSDTLSVIENDGPWGYRDYGANLLAKLSFGRDFDYFVGYDLQNYSGSDAVLVITQHTERTQALFAQVRTTSDLFGNLKLAAGVRYSDPSVGESDTVWNLSGRYEINPNVFVRGQVGTAFRLPTAEELFADDPEDERGNPDLKPETSTNANLSVGFLFNVGVTQNKVELIGFYRDVKDLIDFTSFDDATGQAVFGNVPGTVSVRGGEISLESSQSESWSATLDYTYNHSIDPSTQLQVANVPTNLVKASIDYHPAAEPWGANLTVNHFGKTIATGLWDGNEAYGNDTIVNLSGRVFLDSQRHQRLDLSLQNLFDRKYSTSLGTATRDLDGSNYTYWNLGVPRNLRASYTYHF
ncbi:MAG TPA: TonB-dependent receptor [Steroidobacteraceae bacterium]|jgi:vitamin B12 transporter